MWTFQTQAGAMILPMQPAASPPQNIFYKDETIIASDQYKAFIRSQTPDCQLSF